MVTNATSEERSTVCRARNHAQGVTYWAILKHFTGQSTHAQAVITISGQCQNLKEAGGRSDILERTENGG